MFVMLMERVITLCFHHDTGISSKVTVTPSTLIRIQHRDTARLFCSVKHSTPKAVISWRKKGENETITEGVRFTLTPNGALQIRNIRFEEQGQYECIAENTFTAKKHISTNAASIEVIGGMFYTEYFFHISEGSARVTVLISSEHFQRLPKINSRLQKKDKKCFDCTGSLSTFQAQMTGKNKDIIKTNVYFRTLE